MATSSRDVSPGAQLAVWVLILLIALLLAGVLIDVAHQWGWRSAAVPPTAAGLSVAVLTIWERGWRKGMARLTFGDVAMGIGVGGATVTGVLVGIYLL